MDKELKTKWVNALRSGRYEQGKHELRSWTGSFCCLGVLGRICGVSNEELETASLPGELGAKDRAKYPKLPSSVIDGLADINDDGVPFDMIAGLIDTAL